MPDLGLSTGKGLRQGDELGTDLGLLRAQFVDARLKTRDSGLRELPGGHLGVGLVDPGLPLLGGEAAGCECGVVEVGLRSRQAHVGLVQDEPALVTMGHGAADLILGDPGRNPAGGCRVLGRTAHEAGVAGDESRGELTSNVGQPLVDEQLVMVVGLLVGPARDSTTGPSLVHGGAELGDPSSGVSLSGDRLQDSLRRSHPHCGALGSAEGRPRLGELLGDLRTSLLRLGYRGLELLRACSVLIEQGPALGESILDHHKVGQLPGGCARSSGPPCQLVPSGTQQVRGVLHLTRSGGHNSDPQGRDLLGRSVNDLDEGAHWDRPPRTLQ